MARGSRKKRRLRAWALIIPAIVVAGAWKYAQLSDGQRKFGAPRLLTSLTDKRIDESSGVAPSYLTPGDYYTFNDSGDTARFFKFDEHGKILGVYGVPNAVNIDWEDMASAKLNGQSYLFFGDIGDNAGKRKTIKVYRVPEPAGSECVADQIIELRYPDEPHNAETLLVHPKTGDITVVTKASLHPAGIYFLQCPKASGSYVLRKLADIDVNAVMREAKLITGGAWSHDGKHVVLRTYLGAYEYPVSDPMKWFVNKPIRIQTNIEMQGEGITYALDDKVLITTSEGNPCPVSIIPLEK